MPTKQVRFKANLFLSAVSLSKHFVCCMHMCLQVLYRVGQGNERRPRPLFPICFCFCDRLVCLQVPKRASQGQVSCLQSPFSLYACMLAGAQTCEAHQVVYWTAAKDGDLHQVRFLCMYIKMVNGEW